MTNFPLEDYQDEALELMTQSIEQYAKEAADQAAKATGYIRRNGTKRTVPVTIPMIGSPLGLDELLATELEALQAAEAALDDDESDPESDPESQPFADAPEGCPEGWAPDDGQDDMQHTVSVSMLELWPASAREGSHTALEPIRTET